MNQARKHAFSMQPEQNTPSAQSQADYGSNSAQATGDQDTEVAQGTPALDAAADEMHATGDTHEHIDVGGVDVVAINGVPFTTGQISSLADFVPSIDALYDLDEARLWEILDALEDKEADPDSFNDARWMALFPDTYKKLTFGNANHFGTMAAIDGDLEGTNIGVWAGSHDKALALALEAFEKDDPALADKAIATEAWGSHYLTDAFSAGHLFDKGAAVEKAEAVNPLARGLLVGQAASQLFDAQQSKAIADYECRGPQMGPPPKLGWGPISRVAFVGLLTAVDKLEPEAFTNAPAGAIHDALGEKGVAVMNDLEECWVMKGDNKMDDTSIQYAMLASERAQEEVLQVLASGNHVSMNVLGLVPRPTEEGRAQIEETTASALSNEEGGLLAALVQQLNKQIVTVLEGAVDKLPWLVRKIGGEDTEGPRIPEGETGGALPEQECVYLVKEGDWLSTIAREFYGDALAYGPIVEANPIITDPDLIEVGWELIIPERPKASAS